MKNDHIKNGSEPAHPQSGTECLSGDLNSSSDWGRSGLTKREAFAMAAMQGMLANTALVDTLNDSSYKYIAEAAVCQADTLLKELEK